MTGTLLIPVGTDGHRWNCPLPPAMLNDLLGSACLPGIRRVALTGVGATPAGARDAVAPVLVRGEAVATVTATGEEAAPGLAAQAARLAAARLADAWRAAQEIDSLAGEIVHTYEELA